MKQRALLLTSAGREGCIVIVDVYLLGTLAFREFEERL